MNEKFWTYLKDNLTASEYENLADHIGCGQKRLTRIENGSEDFLLAELKKLSHLLHVPVLDLINDYKLGRSKLYVSEMDELAAAEGMEVGLLTRVA
ncbi:MAG: helix-turn-helix transcriptional regulator [Saprospiraceae bacterium]